MDDSPTERCIKSIRRANMELLDISVKTFYDIPVVRESSIRSEALKWLDEEQIENGFRKSFEHMKLDEKVNALTSLDSAEQNGNRVVTNEDMLNEKKAFLEKELVKVKEAVERLESPITLRLNRLEKSKIPAKGEICLFY